MILNESKAAAASAGFEAVYNTAMLATPQWWETAARRVQSTRPSETFSWSTLLASMKQWVGPRQYQSLSAKSVTLTPAPYSLAVEVPKDAVEDDQIGIFADVFTQMGMAAGNIYNDLVADLFINGFTNTGYDGVAFFSDSHTEDGGATQDNLYTGTLSADNLDTAEAQMAALKAPNGDPLGIRPTHIIHGPSLRAMVRKLNEAEYVTDGVTNMWRGRLVSIESPKITNVRWGLIDLSKGLKPFVVIDRQQPDFQSIIDPTSEPVKERRVYQYTSEARAVGGYLWWQLMLGSSAGV